MGLDAEEDLTEGYVGGDMDEGIRGQMMKLEPVKE